MGVDLEDDEGVAKNSTRIKLLINEDKNKGLNQNFSSRDHHRL